MWQLCDPDVGVTSAGPGQDLRDFDLDVVPRLKEAGQYPNLGGSGIDGGIYGRGDAGLGHLEVGREENTEARFGHAAHRFHQGLMGGLGTGVPGTMCDQDRRRAGGRVRALCHDATVVAAS